MMKKICILVVAVCMVLSACSNKTNNVKFSEFNSEYVPVNEITDTYPKPSIWSMPISLFVTV